MNREATLIVSKKPISDSNISDYVQSWQLKKNLPYQLPYCLTQKFTIKNFKLIGIKNQREITEILDFDYILYEEFQEMFISKDTKKLFVKFQNSRCLLYQFQKESNSSNRVKLEFIRNIHDFPSEFIDDQIFNDLPHFFSPNFLRYVTLDSSKTQFLIKDFDTGLVLYQIPQDLMRVESGQNLLFIIYRFIFIDDETFKIVSEDGIEKLVHIDNGFQQLGFNYIPFFNEIDEMDYKIAPYYLFQPSYFDTIYLIKQSYQNYKSLYLLEGKQKLNQIVPHMFKLENSGDSSITSFSFAHWSLIEYMKNQ
ncbi:UNKNOWN [Stylonychia lemnae]|uniref:Uncharacterized protein n=1 Tax=Stylonychia lemnae TaxID=5949 RepID=A0A078B8V3_STYLE|nr:UNKNOWN [Stylonychia lemnae]|eukprot:CDW90656.1 UNKNOWN [Stylonychia lemnae]